MVAIGHEDVIRPQPTGPRSAGRTARSPAPAIHSVVKFHAPEIVFGVGALAESGFAAARLGARRPFVVTDDGVHDAGWVHELLGHLRDAGLAPVVWRGITPNPKDVEITQGYHRYLESGCDVLIAIGGGSVMDAAKGIAILSGNGGSILDYAGVDQVQHPIPPLLMIPTTSGTGADVSQFCIVTDTDRLGEDHHHGPGAGSGHLDHRPAAADHDARMAGCRNRSGRAHPRHRGLRLAGAQPAGRRPRAQSAVRLVSHYLPATIPSRRTWRPASRWRRPAWRPDWPSPTPSSAPPTR